MLNLDMHFKPWQNLLLDFFDILHLNFVCIACMESQNEVSWHLNCEDLLLNKLINQYDQILFSNEFTKQTFWRWVKYSVGKVSETLWTVVFIVRCKKYMNVSN